MINRVGKMCVATMSLCMIVLIVTRKRRDGRYYFAVTNQQQPQAPVSINGGPFLPLTITRCSAIYFEKNGHLRFMLFSGIIYA